MTPFPLLLTDLFGKFGAYFIFLLIGFFFGYVLEIAGFGNSPKLAAQFYFRDLTVLKVMFTGIIVAMVLIFGASALGLLDYNLVWVNPTYLWPGIIGGLIMGVGFILGGFCPGTSLVAMATLKIDGLFFVLGVLFGIFLFGETVDSFAIFWNSSYMGRFTLQDWLGVSTGTVVLIVVLMALFMFWGGEQLERIIGGQDPRQAPKIRYAGAGVLILAAISIGLIGQPTNTDRWGRIAPEKARLIEERAIQIEPGELLHTIHDHQINLMMIDLRTESDYNLFHLADARRIDIDDLLSSVADFHLEPANTVFVLMSNDEKGATDAWRILVAESVPNVYILEGGINRWLEVFGEEEPGIQRVNGPKAEEQLRYDFAIALGSAFSAADPDIHEHELEFTPKIILERKRAPAGGGCG
jgi:rhodanese-related sulfurtransferase